MKKWGIVWIVLTLFLAGLVIAATNTVVEERVGEINTLDPDWNYDTSSGEAIWQIYENLLRYDGKKFIPMLSTNVPSLKDGTILDGGKTYIFHIRQGVYFHNGDILTPQDVVYSLERSLIFSRSGGPSWMLAEPLFPKINGSYVDSIEQWAVKLAGVKSYGDLFVAGTKTPKNDKCKQALIEAFKLISKAFEIKGNDVIIHLPHLYPPFLAAIDTVYGGSILDKKWAIEQGAWDGKADDWWKYHNPTREKDPLYAVTNGTGPFSLERWSKGREIVFKRFNKYWRGPAKVEYAIIKIVNEFTTRKLDLMRGNADIIDAPAQYLKQLEGIPNVKVLKGFPSLRVIAMYFIQTINSTGNPYIGSGKLDGNGIPPDFFANKDIRMAFEYLFPHKEYIKSIWYGQAITPNGGLPTILFGYNPNTPPTYHQDLTKAIEYFKKAFNGEVWKKGFKFTIVYNTGNDQGRVACEMIKTYARKINPKFKIEIKNELWSSFLSDLIAKRLPMYPVGWGGAVADPYYFAQPFFASTGTLGAFLGKAYTEWAKINMDPLVNESMKTLDPKKRAKCYTELNVKAFKNAIYLWLAQPLAYEILRSDLKGWTYNPTRPGEDFYELSK
ncbi:ABC transporter substrate-binding protein [Mesoaciditoga lauensis]|uniref:ABC transporter substrate-binding protein n=1 Tax=Mesoaciditoga lauensis TaxID=1495039 RepID=UPI0005600B35|nr:ABC transporter substrate-binding protein [Mesoaciditoga lauensis]